MKSDPLPHGFSESPPDRGHERNWEILRCKATESLKFTILSDVAVGRMLHFYGGKSKPCMRPGGCDGCENGNVARWYGYLAVAHARGLEKAVIEITAKVAPQVKELRERFGTLRGMRCILRRRGQLPQGPLLLSWLPPNVPIDELPQPLDLLRMMMRVWELPEEIVVSRSALQARLGLNGQKGGPTP